MILAVTDIYIKPVYLCETMKFIMRWLSVLSYCLMSKVENKKWPEGLNSAIFFTLAQLFNKNITKMYTLIYIKTRDRNEIVPGIVFNSTHRSGSSGWTRFSYSLSSLRALDWNLWICVKCVCFTLSVKKNDVRKWVVSSIKEKDNLMINFRNRLRKNDLISKSLIYRLSETLKS